MLPIQPNVTDFMSEEEKVIVNTVAARTEFAQALTRTLYNLSRAAAKIPSHNVAEFIREGVVIFLKSGEAAPADFSGLLLDVVVGNDGRAGNPYQVEIRNPEIRQCLEVPTELVEKEREIVRRAKEALAAVVYPNSGILKTDYPCSIPELSAEQARLNGWVPVGYELVPVEVLDSLTGLDIFDYSSNENQENNEASKAVNEILLNRAKTVTGL